MRTLREVVAEFLLKRLAVTQRSGVYPPGADLCGRWLQPNGHEITVLCNGDDVTLVMGKKDFSLQRVPPEVALRLGWFLVWSWWVRGTWCGAKLALWYWSLEVKLDEASSRKSRG